MGKEVATQKKQLPAHLQAYAPITPEDEGKWESGLAQGFPVISTKGKTFKIHRGEEEELITNPQDPDEPATYINVVMLDTHPGAAKVYYKGKYVEGSDDKPTCYSNDGIYPAADAIDRQFKNCALCPQNQWGSRITEDGKKAKACSDVKRLAVSLVGQLNDPMLLRVPTMSLKTLDLYVGMLKKRGYLPKHMITKISFDHTVAYQSLLFKPVNFVTEDMIPDLEEAINSGTIPSIIGLEPNPGALPPPDMAADEVVDKATGEVTKKAPAEEEKPALDFEEPEDEDAKAAEEAAAKKKKAAAAKRKAAKEKKAAEEAAAAKKAADGPTDEFDFDLDEDAETEPEKPAKKEAASADVEDDLDFDDLDFGD